MIKTDKNPLDLKWDVDGLAQPDQQSSKNGGVYDDDDDDGVDLYAQARGGKPRFDSTCEDEFLDDLGISSYRHGYPLEKDFWTSKGRETIYIVCRRDRRRRKGG